ncbi:hypothetical protein DOY81_006420 [Sarcophaga bullata]|nr:hypothetical protein DOY81_006420 [Sarcophaga bullata]
MLVKGNKSLLVELRARTDNLSREAMNSYDKLVVMKDTMKRIELQYRMEKIYDDGLRVNTPNVAVKTSFNCSVHKNLVHGCTRSKLKIQTLVKFIKYLLMENGLILKNKKSTIWLYKANNG